MVLTERPVSGMALNSTVGVATGIQPTREKHIYEFSQNTAPLVAIQWKTVQERTLVLVYPPSFFVTAAIPAQPTKPQTIRNGCQEKYLHSPFGLVPAKYPTTIENTKKAETSAWYIEGENACKKRCQAGYCITIMFHKSKREQVSIGNCGKRI